MGDNKITFRVVGIVTSQEFQKCKFYTQKLARAFPSKCDPPKIRPMLNVEWTEYLTKVRRKIGGTLWENNKSVAVFANENYVGTDSDLSAFITKCYRFSTVRNFEKAGIENLIDIFKKSAEMGRKYAYMQIAIENRIVGSLLFLLYSDMVPKTCENFLKRCRSKKKGYTGVPIHRIAHPSWIQGGGFDLEEIKMACENYTVPHDRRGVISMANAGRHQLNSTQFHVALSPTPWMDYRYVAFGQLIQGEEVLRQIESVPTAYESPLKEIKIVNAGEYKVEEEEEEPAALDDVKQIDVYLGMTDPRTGLHRDVLDDRDVDSLMHEKRYRSGLYAFDDDLRSYYPFVHLPDYLMEIAKTEAPEEENPDEDDLFKRLLAKHLESERLDTTPATQTNLTEVSDKDDSYAVVRYLLDEAVSNVLGDTRDQTDGGGDFVKEIVEKTVTDDEEIGESGEKIDTDHEEMEMVPEEENNEILEEGRGGTQLDRESLNEEEIPQQVEIPEEVVLQEERQQEIIQLEAPVQQSEGEEDQQQETPIQEEQQEVTQEAEEGEGRME